MDTIIKIDNSNNNQNSISNDLLNICWKSSRIVVIFSLVDFIFLIFNILFYTPIIVLAIFPLIGFYGAVTYNSLLIRVYTTYVFTIILLKICSLFLYVKSTYYLFYSLLGILLNIFIFNESYYFNKLILKLNIIELNELVNGWQPQKITFIY